MHAPHLIERNPPSSSLLNERQNAPDATEHGNGAEHEEHKDGLERTELIRIAFVALAAAAVWFRLWEPFPRISVIGVAATLIGGYPIFKEAVENIVERKMTMELSMTIALVSALAIGEFFTALVITGFVLAAEVLEGLTVGRGRRAIQDLLDFLPDINDAHLHVKTLSGPVTLNDVRDSHIDIHSVSGNVNIHNVRGSSLEVNSGSGRITYDGDPGTAGEYLLTSHSGDLEVSIPANALVEIKAHSLKGESDPGFLGTANVPAAGQRSLLVKPGIVSASRLVLRSFRGKIHLKRP